MSSELAISDVCTIITVYNSGDKLIQCVESIYNQVQKIILVDDGSDDITLQILKNLEDDEKILVIYNEINSGISVALNKGVKYAHSKNFHWILTLDQDSIAYPNMIQSMLSGYEDLNDELKKEIRILVPVYNFVLFNQEVTVNAERNNGYEEVKIEITSGSLIRTSLFDEIGYFNEGFFIDFVDVEFCLRLREFGYKIVRILNANINHEIGKSEKHKFLLITWICTNHNPIRRYYITRNRFRLWKEYFFKETQWVLRDMISFIGEIIKIIIWEDLKGIKLRMIVKGIYDFAKKIDGPIQK